MSARTMASRLLAGFGVTFLLAGCAAGASPTSVPATPTPVVTTTAVVATPSPTHPTPPPAAASACVVSTLAGKAGDEAAVDGVGTAARFAATAGLAIDPSGTLYVADHHNHTIRKIAPDGIVTTLAGTAGEVGSADGLGSAARFNKPAGLAIDASGILYVADQENHTIRRVTPDGTVTTLAGEAGQPGIADGMGLDARFISPRGVAVDASGNVYVGTLDESAIRKITPDATVTTFAGVAFRSGAVDGVGSAARFSMPWSLAIDVQGVLWVIDVATDYYHSTLRRVTPDGTVTTVEGNWDYGPPGTPWVDRSGVIYLTSFPDSTVMKMTPDGTVTLLAGRPGQSGSTDGPGDVARLNSPTGIVGDPSGVLYVSDSFNNAIRTIRCP